MSGTVVIDVDESPGSGDDNASSAAEERAEEIAVDATVAAAVAATEAAHEAEDASEAAIVAEVSASVSEDAASAAVAAASIADDASWNAREALEEMRAIADSIPERVALALQALTAPPSEEQTIDEVVTETLVPEVAPRGQHWWFRNKLGGR